MIVDELNNYSVKELKKLIKSEAKTANQRLRELEKQDLARSSVAYKYIERLQFDDTSYITTTGKGEIKFNTALSGKTIQELRSELSTIEKFLNTRTSTVSGLKNVFEEAYEKYIEKTGTKPSFQDFSEIYANSLIKNLMDVFGSDIIVQVQKKYGDSLTADEIIHIIEKAGFSIDTKEGEIELSKILDEFEKYKKRPI